MSGVYGAHRKCKALKVFRPPHTGLFIVKLYPLLQIQEISETVGSPYVSGQRLQQYLGVDGGIDPGQPTTQVVQLFSKHFLALLQLF